MAPARISSWRASEACIASGSFSHILVEPSMSVNRKVTVPVGGLATTPSSSLLPLEGHYSSGVFPELSVRLSVCRRFAAFAVGANLLPTYLCERVTDGTRMRALRSHNSPARLIGERRAD